MISRIYFSYGDIKTTQMKLINTGFWEKILSMKYALNSQNL